MAKSSAAPQVASTAALKAVAANAVRHLLEADQHYKAQRFPSATASAVLSIEESGKFTLLLATGATPKARRHMMQAFPFMAIIKTLASLGWMAEWQGVLKGNALGEFTPQQQQTLADHPEFVEFVRRLKAGELSDPTERLNAWAAAALAKENRDGTTKRWMPLLLGGLQKFRLRETYVDVSASGDTWTAPDPEDNKTPELFCSGAFGMLLLIVLLAPQARADFNARDLLEGLPDDLTGQDTVQTIVTLLKQAVTQKEEAGSPAQEPGI